MDEEFSNLIWEKCHRCHGEKTIYDSVCCFCHGRGEICRDLTIEERIDRIKSGLNNKYFGSL